MTTTADSAKAPATASSDSTIGCACEKVIPRVDYASPELRQRLTDHIRSHGVVVVENVFTDAECNAAMDELADSLHALSPALTRKPKTWTRENLPAGPRQGMYHSLVAQFPVVWDIRSDDRVHNVFQHAYSGLRGREITRFVTSCDGINVKPPTAPFHDPEKDWAHVDQTHDTDNIFKCIQGQVVLTNTTAAFRCSPTSHHYLQELLDLDGGCRSAVSDFHLFREDGCRAIAAYVRATGGAYQTCVHARKGSMILWLSSLVHSAKGQDKHAPIDRSDPWSQWRGVVYVCHRPREDVDEQHVNTLETAFASNRVTNHWGSKVFPKRNRRDRTTRTGLLAQLSARPQDAFAIANLRPQRTARVDALLRGGEWPVANGAVDDDDSDGGDDQEALADEDVSVNEDGADGSAQQEHSDQDDDDARGNA
ncbi:hypothetical protein PTSG_06648 [Salpingoeca rosetta]|uniref:Uncharacterized protein n=1 Tax=Salpingoeca rosetta (strain ATCC 50818 / BSB-021) TaxID=946362 RepID=F2UFL1_SALR5|nr:uncharacterized protein PTSG_06648 [Salpingoeca rosetta]EGD75579.1 hypothetical protein PTSG_06648 [Salpingoeca rosetta]|eukprot:XP_004992036.1 hypothetical protein PTSG_06648 [Salpingoeca rosetta]